MIQLTAALLAGALLAPQETQTTWPETRSYERSLASATATMTITRNGHAWDITVSGATPPPEGLPYAAAGDCSVEAKALEWDGMLVGHLMPFEEQDAYEASLLNERAPYPVLVQFDGPRARVHVTHPGCGVAASLSGTYVLQDE